MRMFIDNLINSLKTMFPGKAEEISTENVFCLNQWETPPRVQFILKQRDTFYTNEDGNYSYGTLESGLYNSARFVCEMLNEHGVISEIIQVVDNNSIDREVTRFKPDIAIIEALWVVPEKFEILQKLHPKIKWVIRNHSKIPFLANEGIAMDWIIRYVGYDNVYVSSNTSQTNSEIYDLLEETYLDRPEQVLGACPYLPNYYPIERFWHPPHTSNRSEKDIHIGCFGAVRPLKNHLLQAIAAISFADELEEKLYFHINGSRLENKGEPVLNNLRGLFKHTHHELVEHPWMKHEDFLKLISQMDVCMQVSYSETFNIVAADVTSQGVPIVTSDEIDWSCQRLRANPNSADDIEYRLGLAFFHGRKEHLVFENYKNLSRHNDRAVETWLQFIRSIVPV